MAPPWLKPAPLLRAQALTRRFGRLTAVDAVSLDPHLGKVHAVIGTNGAGKSTLSNTLSGELAASAGRIALDDHDVTPWPQPRHTRAGIGSGYQRAAVFREFGVLENCRLCAQAALPRPWRLWHAAQRCQQSLPPPNRRCKPQDWSTWPTPTEPWYSKKATGCSKARAPRRCANPRRWRRCSAFDARIIRLAQDTGLTRTPPMILEHADIRIHPGRQAEFDAAIRHGVETVISRAEGFLGYSVHAGVESPERYLLQIRWRTLDDHNVGFRGGPLFAQWRAIVGPYFASPPVVEHFELRAASA